MKHFPVKEEIAVCKLNNGTELYIFPLIGTLCVNVVSRLQAAKGNKTGGFIRANTEKSRDSEKVYLNPNAISTFKIEVLEVPEEIKTKIEEYNRAQKTNTIEQVEELGEELSIYFNS